MNYHDILVDPRWDDDPVALWDELLDEKGYEDATRMWMAACREADFVAERDAATQNWEFNMETIRLANARTEAAEAERDEWLTPFEGDGIAWHESLPSPYTYKASDFGALVTAVHAYESLALAAESEVASVLRTNARITVEAANKYKEYEDRIEVLLEVLEQIASDECEDGPSRWMGRIARAALAAEETTT